MGLPTSTATATSPTTPTAQCAGSSPSGTPLLLVPGGGCDGVDWDAVRGAFTGQRRVIVPDLRDHGRSAAPPTGYAPRPDYGHFVPEERPGELSTLLEEWIGQVEATEAAE